ncbi:MAG: tetratricopeptide repeat protein [Gammaproteobacteria bacterium]
MAIVYTAVAWLLLQISDTLGPALHLPEWFVSGVAFLLILGFPVAIVLAWAFELTPDGLKAETKSDAPDTGAGTSSKQLNFIVVAALVMALGYFVIDQVLLNEDPDIVATQAADQAGVHQPEQVDGDKGDKSIAVLPFLNMSSDEEQEYFSDGLSEELLNLLARIPELDVAARTSSFAFKGKDLAIPDIAEQLNVAHVLEGSVRKHGDQVRVTAQLIRADTGFHLWSETYDRKMDNIFEIQEDIAISVVDALKITLLNEAPSARKTEPEAYQLFLEGQYLKRQISADSLNRAVEAFRQSVEIDPSYVPAWAELADTYIWGGGRDKFARKERHSLADQAIETAIGIDPDYAFAYYVRGIVSFFAKNNFERGLEDFQHAYELDPENAFLVAAIGKGAFLTGDFDLAIAQYEKALAMEPIVPEFHWFLGRAYLGAGRLEDAETSFRKLSNLSPSAYHLNQYFQTLLLQGEYEAALAMVNSSSSQAIIHHLLGNETAAEKALAEVEENAHPYTLAQVYGHRGEVDKTFEVLDRMVERGDYYPIWILTDVAFQSIHSDERWPRLLEELGLLQYWQETTADRETRDQKIGQSR